MELFMNARDHVWRKTGAAQHLAKDALLPPSHLDLFVNVVVDCLAHIERDKLWCVRF